ncbi:MAG: DUF2079 domain-containing protein [Dehalococcoidia bacterium]|uniref:DUF2079 domain-containing protein n=1 Tax=Candidatus Amarobacter glycogenicus TaxID=3140699 RepID=UPI003136C3B8|nr:DUF2079 domain-containing protein [Dehalococcoidia bacterium]
MLFAVFAVARHRAYQARPTTSGSSTQVVWNTSNGDWFQTSFVEYNFLGQHFEPILLVFAGFYRLGASRSRCSGAVAVRRRCRNPAVLCNDQDQRQPRRGITLALAYLLNPGLHRALDFDFHPEVMAYPSSSRRCTLPRPYGRPRLC